MINRRLLSLRSTAILAAGLVLVGCFGRSAGQPASAPSPSQPEPRRFSAAGTPEEIGRALGRELAPDIKKMHAIFLRVGEVSNLTTKKKFYERAAAMAEHLSPEDRAEIRGLAEGAGMAFEDALFLNLFYDLNYGPAACRGLAVWGPAAAGGRLLHARNLDWPDYPGGPLRKNNLIVNVRPAGGIEYCFLTWPGLQAVLTGTNRKGLTVSFNQLPSAAGGERLAEPVLFTLKRVLRGCSSAEQAAKVLVDANPMGSGSILISDSGKKTALVVELSGGKVAVRRPAAGQSMIGNANHATSEAGLPGLKRGDASWPTCEVAAELKKPLDVAAAEKVLADQRVLQWINIVSVVFDPTANKMHLSCGRTKAAEGAFREYQIFGE
jgi:hypothetical protein